LAPWYVRHFQATSIIGRIFEGGQGLAHLLEVSDNLFDCLAEITKDFPWVIAMNACDQIGAFANVDSIFVAPFNPLVVLISCFHDIFSLLRSYLCPFMNSEVEISLTTNDLEESKDLLSVSIHCVEDISCSRELTEMFVQWVALGLRFLHSYENVLSFRVPEGSVHRDYLVFDPLLDGVGAAQCPCQLCRKGAPKHYLVVRR
jgi:hypothetical protein